MVLRGSVSLFALLLAMPALAGTIDAGGAPVKQPGQWAQDYVHREADPAVRFGTLPNGMRYAIMHNDTPSDGVAMRLRIGSGSLKERDDEQGLAHYLEHMAFRGSTNIADGEVVRMLERQGLRFGPDTNAFTAQDETVYMFTFPKSDASALDTGMTLFREIGQRLLLSPAAVDAERGVILSEERLRDTPSYQSFKADLANSLAGTRVPERWPIGLVSTIKAATPGRLRRFYDANYRPDNATIVIVGNIDPAKVEAQLKARFSDWTLAVPADRLDPGVPKPAHPAAEFVAPGAPDTLSLSWQRPADPRAETLAYDREKIAELVASTVLNNRLADRAAHPGSPYVGAQAQETPSLYGVAGLTFLQISASPAKWHEALAAVVEEQRRLVTGGAGETDLKRALTQITTLFESAAANAPTRKDGDIADALISAVNDDQVYTSPAQDLAIARPMLAALTPADISAALTRLFSGTGPVLFRAAQAGPVGAPALAAALATDRTAVLAARAQEAAVTWPYTRFGAPGMMSSRRDDAALGTTEVRFANGSRLLVKPTAYEKDRITIKVAFGNGRAGTDPALVHALWATGLTPTGGTAKLPAGDIDRWAQAGGRTIDVQMAADPRAFVLGGTTRPVDFVSEMEVLTAQMRDPGYRPELADKLTAVGPMIAGQIEANAGALFSRALHRTMTGGTDRYVDVPDGPDIAATHASDLSAMLNTALAGPADVVIVGDVTVDQAIAAMTTTFAAGPALPARIEPDRHPLAVAGGRDPVIATHTGRADQAYYGEYWAQPDYFTDAKASYVAKVAIAVLQSRLIDTVREKLGLTYSPQTDAVASVQLPGVGYLGAVLETPPANFATFHTLLHQELADLAAHPVTPDGLDRARRPLIEGRTKDMEGNAFWASWLPLVLRDPRVRQSVLETKAGYAAVSVADVQALFARLAADPAPIVVEARAK
ncbi:M16 family metallopeptidase [Novosphingobium sp.]|uniref:M16 family metallopeptidase n=1 Tax=Novosphingobium sp. TaxID=1874826 RepID=UPI003D096679